MVTSNNHPGWSKDVYVMLSTGTIVQVLEHGRYSVSSSSGLWRYKIKFPDGRIAIWIPQMNDTPLGKHFQYLDELCSSGTVKMWKSSTYLSQEFNMEIDKAKKIFEVWNKTLSVRQRV